jgi:drug/metabolite transporter (DMT)-like permease
MLPSKRPDKLTRKQVYPMVDRHFVSSVLLGLVASMIGTIAYVGGRRHLRHFRGRPLPVITLNLALVFGVSVFVLGLILAVDSMLERVQASYNPQVLVVSMFVPMLIARVIAERRVRRQ